MNPVEERVLKAQQDNAEAEALILEYLPFIKKRTVNIKIDGMDYDDCLSIAMLVFMDCIKQYSQGKGSFLAYAGRCIHNRFVDLWRKESKHSAGLLQDAVGHDGQQPEYESRMALEEYSRIEEKEALSQEIDLYSKEIAKLGVSIMELASISPKQERARRQCYLLAEEVTQDESLKKEFQNTHHIPRKELAGRFGISAKTIEKHRKYIMSLCILLMGDYTLIKSYIPYYREADR